MTPYYSDDNVTIYHGDALEVLPELANNSVDCVLTDPPYVIGAVSAGNMASKSGGWADMMNSAMWFSAWYRHCGRVLGQDGVMWSFLNWRSLPVVMRAAIDAEMPITSMAVWDKEWIGPGGNQGLRPSYEMVALLCRPDYAIRNRGVADIFRHKVGSYKASGHPAEKPEGIISQLLDVSCLPGSAVVMDPFMGSGTTLAAARARGLRVIGIEAEEKWCEYAASRVAQSVLDFGGAA
jgi:site-specific DNA-methyltransferase (adenine-specific)